MAEYSGLLQKTTLAPELALLPATPFLTLAVFAWVPDRHRPRVAVGGAIATAAVLGWQSAILAGAPLRERFLIAPITSLARIGTVDLGIGLALDPLSALVALSAALAAVLVIAGAATDRLKQAALVALGSAMMAILGDGFASALVGWFGLGLALVWISEPRDAPRVLAASAAGDACLLGAVALLFWGLGGVWMDGGDYVPSLRSRASGVAPPEPSVGTEPADGRSARSGSLTMTLLPGSTVTAGGADICAVSARGEPGGVGTLAAPCRERARTPFRNLPLGAAVHDFVISPGLGSLDYVAEKVHIENRTDTAVALVGGTLVHREIDDRRFIRDESGDRVLERADRNVQVLGVKLVTLLGVLVLFAGAAKGAAVALSKRAPGVCALVAASVLAVVVRAAPLMEPGAWAGIIGGGVAVGAAFLASRAPEASERLTLVIAAHLGLGLAGVGFGASGAAALGLSVVTLAVAALTIAGQRGALVARAALASAPLPVGALFARDAIAWTAMAADRILGLALVTIAGGLVAYAVFRPAREHDGRFPAIGLGAALAAAVLGFAGANPRGWSSAGDLWLDAWLAPSRLFAPEISPVGGTLSLVVTVVTFGVALAGWSVARREGRPT